MRQDCGQGQTTLKKTSVGLGQSAPDTGALLEFNRAESQAAIWVGVASRSLLGLVIGIVRGFIASGISRTRSTWRSPFSRLAPLTSTWSASWKLRSKVRAAMPW